MVRGYCPATEHLPLPRPGWGGVEQGASAPIGSPSWGPQSEKLEQGFLCCSLHSAPSHNVRESFFRFRVYLSFALLCREHLGDIGTIKWIQGSNPLMRGNFKSWQSALPNDLCLYQVMLGWLQIKCFSNFIRNRICGVHAKKDFHVNLPAEVMDMRAAISKTNLYVKKILINIFCPCILFPYSNTSMFSALLKIILDF